LDLDQIWWVVSPQNPLKPEMGMAPFEERLAAAASFADDPRIRVTDIEQRLGTRYTADTLAKLTKRCPSARFVWLMGADNMASVHLWHRWHRIFTTVPVAVFDRAPYSFTCLASRAAIRFRRARVAAERARKLAERKAPAWTYLIGSRHPASATAVRAGTASFRHADNGRLGATCKGVSR
jgi:nicotinate-nucleotide adenylyltransferase